MIEAIDTVIAEERPAEPVAPFKRPYLQHLPNWIYADERYRQLSSAEKYALQAIAGRGDRHVPTGSILDCFCGEGLVREIGSPATFWRRMDKFEQLGFVRTVSRGGGHYANVVAIPGQPGLLDRFQVPRRKQRCGAGGMAPAPYVRGSIAAKLPLTLSLPSQDERASVSEPDGCRLKTRRSPSQPATLPSSSHPLIHPHHPSGCADDDVVGDHGERETHAKSERFQAEVGAHNHRRANLQELQRAGVCGPNLAKLAQCPGLTPAHIVLLSHCQAYRSARNPAGWLVDKIASGNLRLDAEDLLKACIAAIRAGRVMQVDGHAVIGPVRWNHNLGLILYDDKGHQMAIIPPDRVYRLTLNTDVGSESAQPHVESLATEARSGFAMPGVFNGVLSHTLG